jgi:DNA invertase Pin-like site-specific DNA recombinase
LVVWKLDRLGRSVLDLLHKMQALEKRGVKFRSLTEGVDTSTIIGTLLLHILGAVAQFERDLIAQRTKTGIAAKKARGEKFGPESLIDVSKCADLFRKGWTVDQVRKQFKGMGKREYVSRQTIYKYFDAATILALHEEGRAKRRKR